MQKLLSSPPQVTLTKAFTTPYDNVVATARTCYSSRIIYDEEVSKTEKSRALRDKIASSTYQAGHHTTLQHAHFQFAISNISRHCLWSFFHAHPFYNSEQVSQRYVEVKDAKFVIPSFSDTRLQERYISVIERQKAAYHQLNELLHPICQELYFEIYRGRRKNAQLPVWQNAIKKRCQEVARYILPIATHAHLYHTVSGLTLYRYQRISQSHDCPIEQSAVVNGMIEAVKAFDPLFFSNLEKALSFDETLETIALQKTLAEHSNHNAGRLNSAFDASLEGLTSKLIDATINADEVIASSVRQILYVDAEQLSTEKALNLVLSPTHNTYLGESLNLLSQSKLAKALDMVHFSFNKKISHSADSQAQRHRMLISTKPIFTRTMNLDEADFITPMVFQYDKANDARALYTQIHEQTWEDLRWLHKNGASLNELQYLVTNAFPIRYQETGSLVDYMHKWTSRLCYNAQEEIWQNSKDEVLEVTKRYPNIGRHMLPPCTKRKLSGHTPVCPEGDRFCGVPVWKSDVKDFRRLL